MIIKLLSRYQKVVIILFFLTLLSPALVYLVYNNNSFLYSLSYFVARVFLISVFFLLINAIFGFRLSAYILLFTIFIAVPVELMNILYFGEHISRLGIEAMFHTNINEGLGFIRGYEWFAVLIAGMFIFYIFSFWKLPKKKKFNLFSLKNVLFLLSFVIICFIFYSITINIKKDEFSYLGKKTSSIVREEVFKKFPLNILFRGYQIYTYKKSISDYLNKVENFFYNSYQTSDFEEEQIYVLVIGESARVSNYQLFGYERETNPKLVEIENLIVFPDFYATSNATNLAIPLVITRAVSTDFKISLREKSIVSLFKEAGFMTYWVCNQDIFKGYGANKYKYEAENFYNKVGKGYDEVVLPVIEEIISDKKHKKKFIVVNLYGNHYGINDSPKNNNHFLPCLNDNKLVRRSAKNRELFINSYDNSVLYQDFVISEIINLVNSSNTVSFVYFSSDHGESLFDEPDFFYGHGASKITKEQLHIPVFFWYSSLFEQYNADKINNLQLNRNKKLSHDNTFYTLSQLSSIDFEKFNAQMSFADSSFICSEIRYVSIDEKSYISVEFD